MSESAEAVALALLELVASCENVKLRDPTINSKKTREWILDTYAECLEAAKGGRARKNAPLGGQFSNP